MPLFSVIIPTFNRARTVAGAIDSVLSQSFQDYEILIVDDGSTDDTHAELLRYGERIRLLRQPNQGPGGARNAGVRQALGQYVAFLDSDDHWFPWTLQVYADVIRRTGTPALVRGALLESSGLDNAPQPAPAPLAFDHYPDYLAAGARGIYVGAGQALVKRTVLMAVGGFTPDRVNGEDHDLALRLGAERGFVDVRAPLVVAWRQSSESESADVRRTAAGVSYLCDRENAAVYPGGPQRRWERRFILCQHARSASLAAARAGFTAEARALYGETFRWQLRFGRWRYLAMLPWLLLTRKSARRGESAALLLERSSTRHDG